MPDTTRRFAGDDDAFAALILRFLDGATTEAEEATLNAELGDPENGSRRDLYVALCRQRGLLTEILPRAPKARSKVWGRVAVAAAVILAVIGIWLLFPFSKAEPVGVAVVERVEGRVVRSDGSAVAAGESLRAGQGLETNGRGRAVFRFDDGTRVTLEAETSLRGLAVRDGKVFRLDRGTIRAKVAKQARPMTVGTPEAEATILGTEFVLRTSKAATRLEVHAGRVQLTRLSDRASAEVAGGQYAVASAGEAPRARSRAAASVLELEPDRWISIPGTAMKSAAPDPARFPAIQGAMGVEAVVAAWSGGAFDTRRNRLVLWGGGHTDYHGNEVYAFSVESMSWERVTEPNPAPRLDFETNADGTPNCRATYNGLAYLVHADRLFSFQFAARQRHQGQLHGNQLPPRIVGPILQQGGANVFGLLPQCGPLAGRQARRQQARRARAARPHRRLRRLPPEPAPRRRDLGARRRHRAPAQPPDGDRHGLRARARRR